MAAIFSLQHIQHYFGDLKALDIEFLELHPQRIYSLCGANGAGKSTLLHCLALLTPPGQGKLFYNGQLIPRRSFALPHYRRQITLVDQNPYLFDSSVEDNLRLGLRLHSIRPKLVLQRIDEALNAVNLSSFRQRHVRQLSGGEQKRVALARALALQPKVLLLDEPTTNMDQASIEILEQVIATLPEQGITVILASHDPDQPQRLNSEVIELSAGRVVAMKQPFAERTATVSNP